MGNISTVLGCNNESDALKAKQIELEEALDKAELYKHEIERVKLAFEKATGRPLEQGILKTSGSFRVSTNLKESKAINKSISFSADHNTRTVSYGDLETVEKEDNKNGGGKDGGTNDNLRNSLRRLFRPFPPKQPKERPVTPPPTPPTPSPPLVLKFGNANGN